MTNTSLQSMADKFEQEINKIHNMVIDLPEELWIKDQLINQVNKRAKKFYDEYRADYMQD